MASCKIKSWRIPFGLKVWSSDNLTDTKPHWRAQSQRVKTTMLAYLRCNPQRCLVADMGEVDFIQYAGLSLNWTSNSTVMKFTVDYSLDGLHWNDYIEDERVKVRRNSEYREVGVPY
ncbi:hypothetical protein OS493_003037 [Desmophyllum pertusum]|uniref:Uncharacterized protein n=1 Tax=Desmophyllum pertusum TaxID=174260 RepID=A0A9W9YGD4_9CNID|nr:hypothetical protein OS493_003037 [Desmophyllum pertusum]